MRRKKTNKPISFRKRNIVHCLLFVSPWLVGAMLFFIYPLFYSLRLSFSTIVNKATQAMVFAGWENFRIAFMEDVRFFPTLLSISKDTLINAPLIVTFSLLIAILLNRDIKGKGLFRTIFFLPVILGTGFVMQQLLGVQVNDGATEVARGILLPDKVVRFLDPRITQLIIEFLGRITIILWKSGVQIIIFLAALQTIPTSLYEAAKVDRATDWECFWFVSLPMLAPNILIALVYTIVASFLDISNEMLNYIHEIDFQWANIEYAAAISWLYFVFVIIVLLIVFLSLMPAVRRVKNR